MRFVTLVLVALFWTSCASTGAVHQVRAGAPALESAPSDSAEGDDYPVILSALAKTNDRLSVYQADLQSLKRRLDAVRAEALSTKTGSR